VRASRSLEVPISLVDPGINESVDP
jgi:hypothetical protein